MSPFYFSNPYEPPKAPKNLPLNESWALFGRISPKLFMKQYWHKKPLLVRNAIPAFNMSAQNGQSLASPVSFEELVSLACQDDVQARLVQAKPWRFEHGPFSQKSIPKLNQKDWTLLIQGMEAHHPAAANVLSWFRFIPDARLDDLMVSVAGLGGGVGPHFDSYDVFLIQMQGRRRWRISEQKDLSLNPNLPLKILQKFECAQDWVLNPGDMLYLPPHIAHDGVALDAGCQTWSVGFRAPSYKELLQEGLWRLAESLEEIPALEEKFTDPKQEASQHPEQLPREWIEQLQVQLKRLKLDQIDRFLPGVTAYLSEPKPEALFDGPQRSLKPQAFLKKLATNPIYAHPQTRILSLGKRIYCNGEEVSNNQSKDIQQCWSELSANKQVQTSKLKIVDKTSLYEAYLAGWLIFQEP